MFCNSRFCVSKIRMDGDGIGKSHQTTIFGQTLTPEKVPNLTINKQQVLLFGCNLDEVAAVDDYATIRNGSPAIPRINYKQIEWSLRTGYKLCVLWLSMRDEDRKRMRSSSCLDRPPQHLLVSTLILNNYLIICMKHFGLSIKTGSHEKQVWWKQLPSKDSI
ncbi:hypothetical protein [Absidia glauca]|uniref:Uncharacterized protein n=1 Tax=Absidia glauca TaxID=4829 RepID=A0A168NYQ9_ABSGL|nr:hypothetical protein [Absidia glauca]